MAGSSNLVRFPPTVRSPWWELTRRLLLAIAILVGTVLLVYLDRSGYHDNGDPTDKVGFVDSIYYTTVTLSTTGYGDIAPYTPSARLVNAFVVTPLRDRVPGPADRHHPGGHVDLTPYLSQMDFGSIPLTDERKQARTSYLHTAAAVGSKTTIQHALEDSDDESIWQLDYWGRTAYDLAIGEHREDIRSLILSAANNELFSLNVQCNRPPPLNPKGVKLSNQSYLQKTGLNFCLFLICEVCNKHMDECHWLHCRLCSKLGEGWDICEQCFHEKSDIDAGESLCPSGHRRADLQLLFIANHMISAPLVSSKIWDEFLDFVSKGRL